jgi:tetratricopeptide (TPR) repeat protein
MNAISLQRLLPALALLVTLPVLGATLSKAHHARLAAAHELIEQAQWEEAEQALDALYKDVGDRPYARALVLQARGWLYTGSGEPAKAIASLRDALALNALPRQAAQDARYLLAQLLIRQDDAQTAAAVMDAWLAASKNPSAEGLHLAGTAHALAGDNDKARPYLERAVAAVEVPPEAWGQRLLSVQLATGQAEAARALLRRLIVINPDQAAYWLQLADIETKRGEADTAVAVLELARQRGLLQEPGALLDLARRWMALDAPVRAASLLQEALDDERLAPTPTHLDLLADAWLRAGETRRARDALAQVLERAARGPSVQPRASSGVPNTRGAEQTQRRIRLAQVTAELEDWDAVLRVLEPLLAAPDAPHGGQVQLLAGVARYHRGELDPALRHFERAASIEETRADAEQWLRVLRPAEVGASG